MYFRGINLGFTPILRLMVGHNSLRITGRWRSALGLNLGVFGATSFDVTQANSSLVDGSKHQGQSYRFLYSKSLVQTGTAFHIIGYRYSTRGFYTLSDTTYQQMSGIVVDPKR